MLILLYIGPKLSYFVLLKEKLKLKLFDDEIITEVLSKLDSDDILLGKEKLVKKLEKKYQKDDEKTRNLKIKKQGEKNDKLHNSIF